MAGTKSQSTPTNQEIVEIFETKFLLVMVEKTKGKICRNRIEMTKLTVAQT